MRLRYIGPYRRADLRPREGETGKQHKALSDILAGMAGMAGTPFDARTVRASSREASRGRGVAR